jgi:DNA-binding transcriptional MerR regulator
MTTDRLLTIREMCDRFDVTPRALRFYESKEMLFPKRQGTRRLYGRSDRARLTLILRGKRYGFSLEEIRQLLDLWNGGQGRRLQIARAIELGQARLSAMRARRDELDAAIADFAAELERARAELGEEDSRATAA